MAKFHENVELFNDVIQSEHAIGLFVSMHLYASWNCYDHLKKPIATNLTQYMTTCKFVNISNEHIKFHKLLNVYHMGVITIKEAKYIC
jgi:hypothetical protein